MSIQIENTVNNKRIAKNTALLYVRMLFSMGVSLYTSRVVLQVLGVDDFGINGVVGGIVGLFSFLNASMSGCTSRFLTFEIGKGDKQKLADTFSTALYVHIAIALIVALVSEPIGLWFIDHKMQIAQDRVFAAKAVFHLSVLSTMIGVTQVPYNASIIAHEDMDVYAYVEMGNVILRLLVVFLLQLLSGDKLILLGVLSFAVGITIASIYRYYCIRNFDECHLRKVWRPDIFKKMMGFSGWDLYGNLSVSMRTQGVNMLLNMFFGPVMNAASAIATQVQGAVGGFAQNVTMAMRPQIIKRYAAGEIDSMIILIRDGIRINFLVLLIISVPLITELNFVLRIWLGEVPAHTVVFCTLTLMFNFFASLSSVLVAGVHATGKIFRPSFINGTLYLAVVPISYFGFKFGCAAWTSYLFNVCAVILGMLSNAYTLKLYIKAFPLRKFILSDLFPCILLMMAAFSVTKAITHYMNEGWIRLLTTCFVSSVFIIAIGYKFIITQHIRTAIKSKIKECLCHKS